MNWRFIWPFLGTLNGTAIFHGPHYFSSRAQPAAAARLTVHLGARQVSRGAKPMTGSVARSGE